MTPVKTTLVYVRKTMMHVRTPLVYIRTPLVYDRTPLMKIRKPLVYVMYAKLLIRRRALEKQISRTLLNSIILDT